MNAPYREPSPPLADVRTLCRLLVDPKKVRVAVRRRANANWLVTVTSRGEATIYGCGVADPRVERALINALKLASANGMDGVDLSMSHSIPHPHGRFIEREREHEDRALAADVVRLINGAIE
jgi:hypothetical protein